MKLQKLTKLTLAIGLMTVIAGCGKTSSNPIERYQNIADASVATQADFRPEAAAPQNVIANYAKVVFPAANKEFRLGEAPRVVTFEADISDLSITGYELQLVDGRLVGASNLQCTRNTAGLDQCRITISPSQDIYERSENGFVTLQFAFLVTFKDGAAREFAERNHLISRMDGNRGVIPVIETVRYVPQVATPTGLIWEGTQPEDAAVKAVNGSRQTLSLLVTDRSAAGTQNLPSVVQLPTTVLTAALAAERAEINLCDHLKNTHAPTREAQNGSFRIRFAINERTLTAEVREYIGKATTVRAYCAFEIQSASGNKRAPVRVPVATLPVPAQ